MKNYFLWLAKLITLVIVFLFFIPVVLISAIAAVATSAGEKTGDDKKVVAVVRLEGEIMDSKNVLTSLYKQIDNKKVKGIVLRINSPGGAVGPSQDIYTAVKKLKTKKPIVASMGSVAASGGFYASLAASKVYAQPGTLTGSVGVIMQVPNLTRISDKIGFDMVTVKSGDLKDAGNPFREMKPEEREFLQGTIGIVHEEFISAIADSRGIDREKVKAFADGRIIVGSQAKELNIIDEFGDVYDAARAVFDILGEPLAEDEMPVVIYPDDKFENFRKYFEALGRIPAILSPQLELRYAVN